MRGKIVVLGVHVRAKLGMTGTPLGGPFPLDRHILRIALGATSPNAPKARARVSRRRRTRGKERGRPHAEWCSVHFGMLGLDLCLACSRP